jgi:hypothetical protein
MNTRSRQLAFLKISSFAAVLLLVGCAIGPRDGQFFPGGTNAPIRFNGFVRSPSALVLIKALNPRTNAWDTFTHTTASATETDCDVAGQCWYAYSVDNVVPLAYWRDAGGNLLRAIISTNPQQGLDGTLVTFPVGSQTDQCISDTYPKSGGVQTALSCGKTFQATITTCKVTPCS